MAETEPSVQGRVPLSHTEYELLHAELEKIHKRQEDFEKKTGDTLQEILSRLPPAPPAP
jgi:tetrahydromethanopterin S-methyltransferase subunit G